MVTENNKYVQLIKNNTLVGFITIFFIQLTVLLTLYSQTSLWFDELFSLFFAQLKTVTEVKYVSNWDVAPPGFNLLMHFWIKCFGISPFAVRFLGCFCTSIACGLVFILANREFNFKTAVFAVAFFITNTNLFYYAYEARCYAFLLVLTAMSSMVFIELTKKPKIIYVVILGVLNYYMFYTHFTTIFLFIAQFIFALFYFKNHLLNWYFVSCGVMLVLLAPFLPRFFELVGNNVQNFWLLKPTPSDLKLYLSEYFNNLIASCLYLLLAIIGLVFAIKNYIIKKQKLNPILFYMILSGVGIIAMSYIESVIKTPLFLKRYLLVTSVGVILSVSYLIAQIQITKYSKYVIIALILVCGVFTINTNTYKGSDFMKQTAAIKKHTTNKTAVITDNGFITYYYDIETFKRVNDLKAAMQQINWFEVIDSTNLKTIDFSRYDNVIEANTWPWTHDKTTAALQKQFKNVTVISTATEDLKTYMYTR